MAIKSVLLLVFGLAFLELPVQASFGFKLDGSLDKEAISHAYFEGDFSHVLLPLETYRQNFPAYATTDDSIFVYKYLSVIYAADSSTRIKGESCMVQLIKMKPAIELIDLYISDNIAAIFKDVKHNYFHQQKYVREHDLTGNTKKPLASKASQGASSKKWIWWTLGGVGTAAIATTVLIVATNDNQASDQASDFKP